MFKSYLKIAWRNIRKNTLTSFINICGLSAGIAFTLVIAGYVWQELQVNHELKNLDNQYIIQSKWKDPNMGFELATFGPLAKQLKEQHPDLVANYYRFDGLTSVVANGEKAFRENMQIGDSTLLKMYGMRLLYGDRNSALNAPFTLVITADMAEKYFDKTDVVGKTLSIQNFSGGKHDFLITGVLDKIAENSVTHLNESNQNQFIISGSSHSFFGRNIDTWANQYIVSYIELKEGIDPQDLDGPVKQLVAQNTNKQISANLKTELVPLKTYYLDANNGLVKKMLYTLGGIALFILLMAIVNFINMSISQSSARMKEIGIRKVVGGLKKQLVIQFLTESVLMVFLATVFSVIIYLISQPFFSRLLGRSLPQVQDFPLYFVAALFAVTFFVGLFAGVYPAFVLSSLKSVDVLKGKLKSVKGNEILRKVLVGFQFATAIIVLAGALIVSRQVDLFFSKGLGYDKEYVLSAQVPRDWTQAGAQKMEGLRNQLAELPAVKSVALSYEIPNGQNGGTNAVYKASADSATAVSAQALVGDEHFTETYSIPMLAGKFFHPGGVADSLNVVVNETQAKALGFKTAENAIGQAVKIQGNPSILTIGGVTRDFHFNTMGEKIQPAIFFHVRYAPFYRYFSFKLNSGSLQQNLEAIQMKWAALMPGTPFEYTFMDDTLSKIYRTELQLKKASFTATVLSLIIAFLGVLGLISITVQKRVKEISIRKVLGSSVVGIVIMFIKEFLWIVVVAALIASPIAWYLMQGWLNDYAYRINLNVQPFLLSIGVLALITAIIISAQTVKAALANPVKSLRSE